MTIQHPLRTSSKRWSYWLTQLRLLLFPNISQANLMRRSLKTDDNIFRYVYWWISPCFFLMQWKLNASIHLSVISCFWDWFTPRKCVHGSSQHISIIPSTLEKQTNFLDPVLLVFLWIYCSLLSDKLVLMHRSLYRKHSSEHCLRWINLFYPEVTCNFWGSSCCCGSHNNEAV